MKKISLSVFALLAMLALPLAYADDSVARAIITTGVVDREPVDDLDVLQISDERAYFFTELRGMTDQTVTHRWTYNGDVTAEIDFHVGGPRWRVWSSKGIMADQQGEWLVEVVDGVGNVIGQKAFQYAPAP